MASVALQVSVNLVAESCCTCGINFAMPDWLQAAARQDGRLFYCPSGHNMVYRDNENARLKKELDKEKLRAETLRRDVDEQARLRRIEEEARAAVERKLKRTEKRARAGVCLDCNRTFKDVERHRAMKHGDAAARVCAVHEEKAAREESLPARPESKEPGK